MLLKIKFHFAYQRHMETLLFYTIYSSHCKQVPTAAVSARYDYCQQKSFRPQKMCSTRLEKRSHESRGNVILWSVLRPRYNSPFSILRPFSSTYHGLHFRHCLKKSCSFESLYQSEVFQHQVLRQNRFSLFCQIQLCYAQMKC